MKKMHSLTILSPDYMYELQLSPAARYWCADQMMVQKALSAKSLSDAQGATILTGWIKVLPMFLIIIPGMISRVLYPDTVSN